MRSSDWSSDVCASDLGNSQATIDSIREDLTRYTKSTLATYDFRFSKGEFVELPGGWLGFAAGIEARRETQPDDRDPRIDGTITYTDPLTGNVQGDFVNSALNPDTSRSEERRHGKECVSTLRLRWSQEH